MRSNVIVTVAISAMLATGCSTSNDQNEAGEDPEAAADEQEISVFAASYDLAVGENRRFTAGLILEDATPLVGGDVSMEFFYFGEDGSGEPESVGESSTGTFLEVPGTESDVDLTEVQAADGAIGVYQTAFDFDRPGRYGVGVIAVVDGERLTGTGMFDVAAETAVPEVGDVAPTVPNPLVDGNEAPAVVDSRAQGDGVAVPDPGLHETTLEESLSLGNRAIVLLSTPVYCASRFCGPITDEVEQLASTAPDDVDVIHIEVWEDFDAQELHPASAAWIQTESGGNEPWLFVVDSDGTVLGRWDNVVDLEAVRELLDI